MDKDFPTPPWMEPDYSADLERALLSYGVYSDRFDIETACRDSRGGNLGEFDMPKGWNLLSDKHDSFMNRNDSSGVVAAAFVNSDRMSIVIAYRGSDNPADAKAAGVLWVDGQPLAALGVPFVTPKGEKPIAQMAELQKQLYPGDQWHPQFDDALDYAKRIRDKYEPLGYTFEAVGHGLGGSEAQIVAHTFGWGGRTFDALGAQNLTESRGYASWLANNGIGSPPGPLEYDESAPWDENFLNYGVRFSMTSEMTGPHLGKTQVVSALAGREGLKSHATYVVSTTDAAVSEVPLVGDFVAGRSGLRAARAGNLGTFVGKEVLENAAVHGADVAERHGMANIVRKFQIAAEQGKLPTFGDEAVVPEVGRRLSGNDASGDARHGHEGIERNQHGGHDLAMLEQIRGHVHDLDRSHGREYDEQSERISHSLLALAKDKGLVRVDHVVLGETNAFVHTPGLNLFVVQGKLDDPAHVRAHMNTELAARTTLPESGAHLETINRRLAREQANMQAQAQVQQEQAPAIGPTLRMM